MICFSSMSAASFFCSSGDAPALELEPELNAGVYLLLERGDLDGYLLAVGRAGGKFLAELAARGLELCYGLAAAAAGFTQALPQAAQLLHGALRRAGLGVERGALRAQGREHALEFPAALLKSLASLAALGDLGAQRLKPALDLSALAAGLFSARAVLAEAAGYIALLVRERLYRLLRRFDDELALGGGGVRRGAFGLGLGLFGLGRLQLVPRGGERALRLAEIFLA